MKILAACILAVSTFTAASVHAAGIVYPGGEGPGKGKHVVLLAGDEEYRSEESLPMLGKLLSQRHGFECTVLFSINKQTGDIDPNTQDNEPGLEALDHADLVITSLRFRKWPEEQMKHFVDYYQAGKPFIGLRTSTHSFLFPATDPNKSFNAFGKNVYGEQWVNHWGRHKSEATRGVIEPGAEKDPLLNGVENIFGTTDVYEAYPPADVKILARGIVLKGMKQDDPPAEYKKQRATDKMEQDINTPAMPVIWTREHKNPDGKINKILCTTMGAATDFTNDGFRRLIVNAAYALTGLEVPAKADISFVGEFKPTMYGFDGFIKGVKPEAHLLPK